MKVFLAPPLLGNTDSTEVRVIRQVDSIVSEQQHQLTNDFTLSLMAQLLKTPDPLKVGLLHQRGLGQTTGGPTSPHFALNITAQLGEERLRVIDLRDVPGPVLLPVPLREPPVLIHSTLPTSGGQRRTIKD